MYKHPGVYIEHVPSGLLAIEAASTSVAAFVGPVKRGPVGEPVFITSASQFALQFGALNDGAGGIRDEGDSADKFGHAVNAFFGNGGNKAYIVRVAETSGTNAPATASTAIPNPEDATRGFTVDAVNRGAWGNDLIVRLSTVDEGTSPDLTLGYVLEVGSVVDGSFTAIEAFTDLQMASDSVKFIETVVNANSTLIKLTGGTLGAPDNVGPVTSIGLRGDPVTFATSGNVEVGGRGVDIGVGADTVTVVFAADTADVGALARQIQEQVRAGIAAAPDFTATVELDGANRRLILRSGILGTGGDVSASAPTAPPQSALSRLGLNVAGAAMPVTTLSGGGLIEAFFDGGTDAANPPAKAAYDSVYQTLRDYRDVSIVLLPGKEWIEGGDNSVIEGAVTHSEFMQNRMVIVDPPDPVGNAKLVSPKDVKDLGAPTSPYTALYYPWLEVANPHYNPDTAANRPKSFRIPPSGFAAGMWARIDSRRGVWKAPAGLEATVRGSIGPNVLIGNDLQDNLNELGINCLRSIIGPTVIWGARTLATKAKPEFRYVPVRRTQNMIGESLYAALQAVVFEPNDHRLWASLRASVTNFMDGLFRAGAFQGEKASDAYYVLCGLGSTMTQGDIDAGIVRVVVGFAPLKPAEFVVVQIKQIVGQTA
ncbi:MAG: phage tail sheath subtilisin-like domain-containing protein [Brucellaceae bacterium]|nr:phage tail sheath subtilisin-like domain-containing protein [Brucellaceae bacterium]